jgi:serine/threonine protein kinase/Tol biopolymer transport system component
MPLSLGSRLGPYEVIAQLGAGGMGVVYRGRDTRLNRDVALKILPDLFAADPDRLARFRREAQVLASLNHPNIGAIYGLEESDSVRALVLELVEGATLAERIAQGPVPVDEALPIARQIAEALDAAHEQGIIHRDLKPANIKIRPDSTVKVLDFGLAKAFEGEMAVADISQSPTLSVAATQAGVILGTAAYMAPEQARGKVVNKRADIWAFGCVLYEMLTGRRAFDGADLTDTLAFIITKDPDWTLIPSATPESVRRLLRRCLRKDRNHRLADMADVRLDLHELDGAANDEGLPSPPGTTRRGPLLMVSCAGALTAGVALGMLWDRVSSERVIDEPSMHVAVATSTGVVPLHSMLNPGIAISPDGTQLVYAGSSSDGDRLYLQDLYKSGAAAPLRGTEGGLNPFFSSDGKWIAFVARNKLQTVAISGGEPLTLADASFGFGGGTWSVDDETIYFVPALDQGIWRVSSRGGTPVQITKPDRDGFDNSHLWPSMLPSGDQLLYTSAFGRNRIVVLDLRTGTRTPIVENGFFSRYMSSGHLVFAQGHSLLAASFNPETLQIGSPTKILDTIVTGHEQHAQYDASRTGRFVYFDGTSDFQRQLVRIDRGGQRERIGPPERPYDFMSLAPDGRRVAVTVYEGQQDLFIYDLLRGDFDRITSDPHNDFFARWSPDGRTLVFSSVRRGQIDLYIGPADKSSPDEVLYANENPKWPNSWSPDGTLLAFVEQRPGTGLDIWMYSMGDRKARPFRTTTFNETYATFSPDGHWLAFASDELGQFEVYVVPYPGPGPTCKVSIGGGSEPRWSADGRELFYRRGTTAMVVDVASRNFCNSVARALFDGLDPSEEAWAVSPKGDFFITYDRREPPQIHLVLNWFEELKRLVPPQ